MNLFFCFCSDISEKSIEVSQKRFPGNEEYTKISSKKIEELFLSIKDKYTIVLVTHTLRQAKRIADYVAFMYMGELIEFGTADQLFNHPKHQLTKDYIGGGFS